MNRAKAERARSNGRQELKASFAQMSKTEMRTKGLCFNCGHKWQPGHKCKKKKEQTEEAQQHAQSEQENNQAQNEADNLD